MTQPRPWPNSMKHHRDRAAEEINDAAHYVDRLLNRVQKGEFTRQGLERDLLEISRRLHIGARHLEAAGAETVPE